MQPTRPRLLVLLAPLLASLSAPSVPWSSASAQPASTPRAPTPRAPAASPEAERATPTTCPETVAADTRCLFGRDSAGAYYWFAVPPQWNGTLVVHAHGGPELGEPKADRTGADLARWSIWTRAGYAYAGTGYHQGGVAVRSAADDLEQVRRLFVQQMGAPRRTILHGQSWGASVAAKAAEVYATTEAGHSPYDGVLLTSGVLGGGSQSYDFRFDLRVVYQAVCSNHPQANEASYPLWQGLPLTSKLTRAQLADRVEACTGVRLTPAQRTPQQQHNLDEILAVVHIPERSLISHLNWGTWHFQDIVFRRLGGRNPFSNVGVVYGGSSNDAALNAKVFRAGPDAAALREFTADADIQGHIPVPVLTMHAVNDPTAFVELESVFRETMERGGSGDHLVQLFTDDSEHSYLSDAQNVTAMRALLNWVERHTPPTPAGIAAQCRTVAAAFTPDSGCRFLPGFTPAPLSARVPRR